jgi:uncharacterized protein (TIGR01777 family)
MKIVIAGGSGFVGSALLDHLASRSEVVVLTRDPSKVKRGRGVEWDGVHPGAWGAELDDADAVINLAGAGIGDERWSAKRKELLLRSRVESTNAIVEAMRHATPRAERVLLNASAIGIYGDRGDEVLDESSSPGSGFLAALAVAWEAAARAASPFARVIIVRFGLILDRDGGALPKMIVPFRLFAGGQLGNGRQWMSWVDLRDVVSAISFLLELRGGEGIYNIVAPAAVTNRQFTKELGKVLHRPTVARAPAVALRLALGEMADELLLASQRVEPRRLSAAGFEFGYSEVTASLRSQLGTV